MVEGAITDVVLSILGIILTARVTSQKERKVQLNRSIRELLGVDRDNSGLFEAS